jgi:hypothetical protein
MELLIAYEERDSLQLPQQRRHFAKYNIARETLVDLPALHEQLLKVEQLSGPDTTNTLQ